MTCFNTFVLGPASDDGENSISGSVASHDDQWSKWYKELACDAVCVDMRV